MALSGTLDTFALPDVLRLLASTNKTGRLRISGDRGSGSVWVADGQVVASELTTSAALEPTDIEVVFGLLRFTAGSFSFEADAAAPNAEMPMAMEPILGAAENMLAEWRSIEEVVPSLDVWIGLAPELRGPDVMVDSLRWRCIATVGSGAQVGSIAETLGLNEVDSCRAVKELIELRLVEIIDEPAEIAGMPATVVEDEVGEPEPGVDSVTDEATVEFDPEVVGDDPAVDEPESIDAGIDEEVAENVADGSDEVDDADDSEPGDSFNPAAFAGGDAGEHANPSLASLESSVESAAHDTSDGEAAESNGLFGAPSDDEISADDLNPAEMAKQLANLSPKAAKAVAAAARASTDAEREAALAAVEAEDDSVNRGLLLKFLGSVES